MHVNWYMVVSKGMAVVLIDLMSYGSGTQISV